MLIRLALICWFLAVRRWRLALEYKVDIIFKREVGGEEVLVAGFIGRLWRFDSFNTGRTAEKAVRPVARTGFLKLPILRTDCLARYWERATRPTVFSTVGRVLKTVKNQKSTNRIQRITKAPHSPDTPSDTAKDFSRYAF